VIVEPTALRSSVEAYYTRKVLTFGPTPLGVDWPSTPSLELRLVQLLKVCDFSTPISLNDLGCGYGAALALLRTRRPNAHIDYLGVDLSAAMVDQARTKWAQRPLTRFLVGHECGRLADYSIASGIFNVKLGNELASWTVHVRQTLLDLHRSSRHGFAVNFMRPVAWAAGIDELYAAEPAEWIGYCRGELGRSVELLEGYGLPEYSLLVR